MRFLMAASAFLLAFVLAACGGGSGPSLPGQGPASAQSVAASDSDFSGLHRCPESGSYDNYLKAEQAKDPSAYQSDTNTWNDMKKAGANDSYIAVYAESNADCGQFNSTSPSGKLAYVFAIRFKDASAASASFKNQSKDFHLDDAQLAQIKGFGGTVQQGSVTSLGDNSINVSFAIQGITFYIAFWQNKQFEVAMIEYNVSGGAAESQKINGRIH